MKRIIIAAILAAFYIIPSAAQAGCVANADQAPIVDVTHTIYATPRVHCTTNNGIVYELRTYIQTNTGVNQSFRIDSYAVSQQIYNGGAPIPNYWAHQYTDHWPCSQFTSGSSLFRVKAVLENAVTNSISVTYSPVAAPFTTCHA